MSLFAILWWRLERVQILALTLSVLFCLLLGELVCRVLDIGNPLNIESMRWSEDPSKGEPYEYQPNGSLSYRYPDNPRGYFDSNDEVRGHINEYGFRGPKRGFEKPAATTRIAFLGDSFTLGFGVRDEHSLPAQLELLLGSENETVEVLNFGVTNSSTDGQVELLDRYVLSFDPDLVVIVTFLNDTERVGTQSYMNLRWFARIRRRSFLANAIVTRVERIVVGNAMIDHYLSGYEEDNAAWQRVKDSFERAGRITRKLGIPLVVVIHPVLIQLDESYPLRSVHEKIARHCRSVGAKVIDLLPAFEGQVGPEMWVHPSDQHPNEVAHGLTAAWIARALKQDGLLDAAAPATP